MEEWSNNACLGYVIKSMQYLGYKDAQIKILIAGIKTEFDFTSVDEAADVYNKSPY